MNLVLFDIDGTLLLARGAGLRAMTDAGQKTFGDRFTLDGINCAGALDPHILRWAAEAAGVELTPQSTAAFRDAYLELLPVELARVGLGVSALPGAVALVQGLRSRARVTLGLLTGNYREAAHLKLAHAGFDVSGFTVGAFGDMAPVRSQLVPVAVAQMRERGMAEPSNVVVVGDTPRDVECARDNGCHVLAVATGRYSVEQLRAAGADHVVADLSGSEPLDALLRD